MSSYLDLAKLLLHYADKLSGPIKGIRTRRKFGYSSHDVEMLEFFYPCFDRPAFRDPFHVEVPGDMIRAIEDTIIALSVGIRRTRDGVEIARGHGKAEFESPELRARFDAIVSLLHDIVKTFEIAFAIGALEVSSGWVIVRDSAIPKFMDDTRNQIISIANDMFVNIRRPPFPQIRSSRDWTHEHLPWVHGLSESRRRSLDWFYRYHLHRDPPPWLGHLDEETTTKGGFGTIKFHPFGFIEDKEHKDIFISVIPIYLPYQWSRLVATAEDANEFPHTWEEWNKLYQKRKLELESLGKNFTEVTFDLDAFETFCQERGLKNNRDSRALYMGEMLRQQKENQE